MNANSQLTTTSQGQVGSRPTAQEPRHLTISPAVDIFEDEHGVTLWADLPGVSKDKLNIRVQDGTLSIEGEALVPAPQNLRLQHAELKEPRFSRSFMLSADFDTSRIEAQLRDGVLRLTVPRREEARPRKIEVQVA
ncbi:Hsp20/alpha crystallin family protein [Pandoraea pulmonicola]|uniref:Heat-shock protein n=1 Tax=Pandoraea pulmonicola TaxID=93221 RepID=A0AAJ4ZC95_PANPU|nr:Hsp20/alpha crystallin family protein [Pandoraea pulmonicola]AJC20729.1 heat-shock protein [Pandoraea pulmonicola]SUA90752.1 Spore protein SP21 [Pandoraea pulmonicola]